MAEGRTALGLPLGVDVGRGLVGVLLTDDEGPGWVSVKGAVEREARDCEIRERKVVIVAGKNWLTA